MQHIAYDGIADAEALKKAMKGFGTNEKLLIATLADKDPLQVAVIQKVYQQRFGKNLINEIKSEVSGSFEDGLTAIVRGPLQQDILNLIQATDGPGTKEKVLNDVLLGRSNADMKAIKEAYQKTYHRNLEADIKADLSMKTERHFLMVLAANRNEDSAPVIPQQIDQDVLELYKATEGKTGTDELLVCQILTQRSNAQIAAIAHTYKQKYQRDLETVIKKVCFPLIPSAQPQPNLRKQNSKLTRFLLGILRPHGRCPNPSTPHRNRQSHARRHPPRRNHVRRRHQGQPARQPRDPRPLGQKSYESGERRVSCEIP